MQRNLYIDILIEYWLIDNFVCIVFMYANFKRQQNKKILRIKFTTWKFHKIISSRRAVAWPFDCRAAHKDLSRRAAVGRILSQVWQLRWSHRVPTQCRWVSAWWCPADIAHDTWSTDGCHWRVQWLGWDLRRPLKKDKYGVWISLTSKHRKRNECVWFMISRLTHAYLSPWIDRAEHDYYKSMDD